jgi:uncharacterized membrane protein YbhN (UPF0104 family)
MPHAARGLERAPPMTTSTVAGAPAASGGPVGAHPVRRIVLIVACIVSAGAFAVLVGWDIRGWFESLWDTLSTISTAHLVGAVIAMTVKTTATAFAWYTILRYAYPGEVRFRVVYAAYSVCVALNMVLPANLGTIVMFVMLTTVIASATFAGMLGGFAVQKIFFTLAGVFVYLYLFLTVPGSFDISFEWIRDHPWVTATLVGASAVAIGIAVRTFWPRVVSWWEQAKEGGEVLVHPRAYSVGVFFPEFVAWVANLFVVAIFLSAYAIPVTFHTVMSVVGSNSVSNTVAVTPGGAGVNQAFNVAALKDVTDSQTATAYSLAEQLVTTAWSLLMAIVLMIWVFGWGGGRALVSESYADAKQRVEEQKAARDAAKRGLASDAGVGQTQPEPTPQLDSAP